MKIYYANDTQFHEGSVAVSDAIYATLRKQGHTIYAKCVRPNGPNYEILSECDALVVNGEGTFRDEQRQWEPGRQKRLMDGMVKAKEMGLKVHFMNATWCNMTSDWSHALGIADEVAVREPISAREMMETQGIEPDIYLDMSYYAKIEDVPKAYDADNEIILGRLYPHNFPDQLTEEFEVFNPWKKYYLPILDPGLGYKWSTIVQTLRKAKLYITGQHHGVYAACKARTPFVYCKCNTHKVDGLFEWAGVNIPTVNSARDVVVAVEWALANRLVYDKLFDFMEERVEWPGVDA